MGLCHGGGGILVHNGCLFGPYLGSTIGIEMKHGL